MVFDAFRAGAKGIFCPSKSPFKALCRCVERVHAGQIWAKSSEVAHVLETFCRLAPMRVVNADGMKLLTKREEDVVRLLGDGPQNREIAHELNLSEHTVKNYLSHIFDKLGVSRVELILYAVSSTKRTQAVTIELTENEKIGGPKRPPIST
jgi:DNA-binding NarL/FixJ family response regulator